MKKRLLSILLTLTLLVPTMALLLPVTVYADGWYCEFCSTYYPEDEDVKICFNCYICENCADGYCEECRACMLCASELDFHCPECGENCVDESYGNFPHCEMCMRCEDCVELHETPEGMRCDECIEEMQENEFNIMCPNCEEVVIGSYLEDANTDMEENLADCGEHCIQCYEKFVCPECYECTLCSGAEICDTCGICLDCATDEGYHCPDCGECYAEAGQCPDNGEHCTHCCEDVCENCSTCTRGAEIEYCETCHLCESCWEHCSVCDECMEEIGRCEDDGEHCRECCVGEGWLCDQCERCTEALGLEFCEYCGLCEDCCAENSEYYGIDRCILDENTKIDEIDPEKHDDKHHLLRYTSSSDECHDVWCAYPGCDYYISDETPHVFIEKTVEKAEVGKDGKSKKICVFCGVETEVTIPKIEPPEFYFVEQPKDMEALPNSKYISFYVHIGQVGTDVPPAWGFYTHVSAFPVIDDEKLPETVKDLLDKVYHSDIRRIFYAEYGMSYEKNTGIFPSVIYGKSGTGSGKFANYEARGNKLTWRLAVYDQRGGKITYSDPFTIDWNAKHNEHTWVWVCGKLGKWEKMKYDYALDHDYSALALKFKDSTYHWRVCSVCNAKWMPPQDHRYTMVGFDGNCVEATQHYKCVDCGHTLDIELGRGYKPHSLSADYRYDDTYHWKHCVNKGCDYAEGRAWLETAKHDLEKTVYTDCNKTITTYQCKTCGYIHLEHDYGPGHKYSSDGDFNGWYSDTTNHWRICSACGKVDKAEHTYKGGACTVCGIDIPQMGIIGVTCTHGTSLTIEMVDDIRPEDAAKFKAGQWNATWIDNDTGYTVGLGQTFPLDEGDEGHQYRAEVSITGGEDYNAYMTGPIHTEYKEVKGYPATCAAEGMRDHKVCLGCGGKFIGWQEAYDVTIPKTNDHTYTNDCDATCNVCGFERQTAHKWSDGYSFDGDGHFKACTVCGVKSSVTPHSLTLTWKKNAACEQDGQYTAKCECGYSKEEKAPATGHSFVHADALDATCISEGAPEHYVCENCGACAKDEKGTEKTGIKKIATPVDPNNHVGGDKLGYTEKEHYTICECGAHIKYAEHTFDKNGRCTVCRYKKDSNVKTGGKTLTMHDKKKSDCSNEGVKKYFTDADGKIYLSRAGVKEVASSALSIPKSTKRHVGGDYGCSETQHWIECSCGEKLKTADHEFDGNKVCTVCGYIATSATFPWWVLIVIGALIVCGGTALIVIFILRKKKKEPEDTPPEGEGAEKAEAAPPEEPETEEKPEEKTEEKNE